MSVRTVDDMSPPITTVASRRLASRELSSHPQAIMATRPHSSHLAL